MSAKPSPRAPYFRAAQAEYIIAQVGGGQHRVGCFGGPHTPQLTGIRWLAAQFVKYRDRVYMGLGDAAGDDVILGECGQALPAFPGTSGRGQRQFEPARIQPMLYQPRRHAQSPAAVLPSWLR